MGKQIADNKEPQLILAIVETNDRWHFAESENGYKLIRGEYTPYGGRLIYPKKWSRKKAALILLNHYIEDNKRMLAKAEHSLKRLNELLDEVNSEWTDNKPQ